MYRFIDLFAGIGGLRLALEAAGCECVYSSEWNKFSRAAYEANFHEVPQGDITSIAAEEVPDHDILVGGFPCQPFSIAGVSRTLSARYYKDGSEILIEQDGANPRRLTPRECARLQGFPDSYRIPVSDTQAYRQFGNSVAVPLMAEVARALVAELDRLDALAGGGLDA